MRAPDSGGALRLTTVALLALLELAGAFASISALATPVGTYGFLLEKDGTTIAAVGRDSPAARAGIAAGDRIVYATLPLRGRRFAILEEEVPGDAPITFSVVRAGAPRAVTLRAESIVTLGRIETLAYALAGLALGLVGLLLVVLRPSLMTWSFAAIAPALLVPYTLLFWSQRTQSGAAAACDVLVALLYALQTAAIMLFASRFPDDRPAGIARVVDRLSLPFGAVVAAIYAYVYLQVRFAPAPPLHWISLADFAVVVPSAAALAALISTYVTTPGSTRSRLAPVIASFVLLVITGVLTQIGTELTANGIVLVSLSVAFSVTPALVAVAVAYGVIRHRVMDVSFIVSRTLVLAAITIAAVALLTSIEFLVGKVLERQRVATILEIAAAIGLGLSLNVLHGRIDDFVDRALFRKRHLAERRLAGVARAVTHASGAAAVDAALVDEPSDAFGLASAAVFRYGEGAYHRVHARGWREGELTTLSHDDPLALRLRADLEPLDPHETRWARADLPTGERAILYAVPVVTGDHLEAIAFYGGHVTGEDLDPDERRTLRALASAAAAAYDRIAAGQLRRQLEIAQSENAALRSVERKLTELLGRQAP